MPNFLKRSLRGAMVAHRKHTAECQSVRMPVPDMVYQPMVQHMGAPCTPTVKIGDLVKVGQVIGDCDKPFSAPIHASVSGKVTAIQEIINPMGIRTQAVVIQSDKQQTVDESVKPPEIGGKEDFLKAVRASGVVGLGGAGFPTHIKLNPRTPVDTLIVNIAECEPYITTDYRNCMENGEYIVKGIELMHQYVGITTAIIGIEDNKPEAAAKMQKLIEGKDYIEIHILRSQYPQGAEKVLIWETTRREVGATQLPSDVGCLVLNGTTTAFIARYIETGMPLAERMLTVDGSAVNEPKNVIVPLGTRFNELITFCGGYKKPPKKLLMGGPMMGIAVYDDNYPVIKNNNAILAFDEDEARVAPETDCIRCGRCVNACPFSLMPANIERCFHVGDLDGLKEFMVMRCMECGCCAYVCPAKRHLVMTNKLAKKMVRENTKK